MRRARPLLGTFVEIEANGLADPELERAIAHAFEAIERVHRLMSFHDPQSDISRLNRHAVSTPVVVDPWTMKVLRKARCLYEATDGLFDCVVGYEAIERGLLPSLGLERVECGTFSAVEFVSDRTIRLSARIAIDFGGIAKGFAVDRAIAVLRSYDVREALVNAGGDMRVMGEAPQPVFIRCPGDERHLVQAGLLRNAAIATSAASATLRKGKASTGSLASASDRAAYSVIAPTCLLADAMTKVLVQLGDPHAGCFAEFGVMAFVTSPAAIKGRAA
ncbi:FAD:protein FMN transferase [Bradyrhizobium sp. AZCC 2230]|uniref:FAD:protein FMN transferase n=1 Tax=Bradyrhizobium sp. AZCC 2230 TaxID=3117021 RepID=UPI002FEFAA34